ncbi:heme oxygenase 1-like [Suricata suricatta]|uniref:heme oxygenase 1-like n=1 Tax=Suricata suricatta TaxID=37032 RepID=UPI0011557C16|nr:heme oxygenase 1-like [Suricata suricatta]
MLEEIMLLRVDMYHHSGGGARRGSYARLAALTCSLRFQLVMASLYHVYVALEEEIERNKENPVYAPLYFPEELHRKAALERDMAFWYGPRWEEAIPYTQATRRYVRRLHEVGRTEPELLVAHAYTRYLGDLSGGQVLKKIAQKALDLPSSGEGVDFFTFPNIASATKFKQLYRARMNTLEMTPEVRQRVIEEAKAAFLLNIQVRSWLAAQVAAVSPHCSSGTSLLTQREWALGHG